MRAWILASARMTIVRAAPLQERRGRTKCARERLAIQPSHIVILKYLSEFKAQIIIEKEIFQLLGLHVKSFRHLR